MIRGLPLVLDQLLCFDLFASQRTHMCRGLFFSSSSSSSPSQDNPQALQVMHCL